MTAPKRSPFLGHTDVSADRSIAELQKMLGDAGASSITLQNDVERRRPVAVQFTLTQASEPMTFELPARTEGVLRQLQAQRKARPKNSTERDRWAREDREQAEKVAWRQVRRWVEAQLALVNTQMVDLAEVFLPYVQMPTGRSLYAELCARGPRALLQPSHDSGGRHG